MAYDKSFDRSLSIIKLRNGTLHDSNAPYGMEWGSSANDSSSEPHNGTDSQDGAASAFTAWNILLVITLGFLDVITILGNLLVCVTVVYIRRLRKNVMNYFIFSLALSDLLLGVTVLPFSVLLTVAGSWPLGAVFCNIYVCTDVMVCTVSILNLFAISLDRYFAITLPLRYDCEVTPRRVIALLLGIWFFSAVMAFLPIFLGWNTYSGRVQNVNSPQQCVFEGNKLYVMLVSVGTYFIPLIVMCAVYAKVFSIAREQAKAIKKLMVLYTPDKDVPRQSTSLGSDTKATFTLASVLTAFTICWVPYFVLFTARPFVAGGFPAGVDLAVLWLGYANSTLNPFLYAFHNHEFRDGFFSILCRRRPSDGGFPPMSSFV